MVSNIKMFRRSGSFDKLGNQRADWQNIFSIKCLFMSLFEYLFWPECIHALPRSPCTDLDANICKTYIHVDHCCCDQCSHWISLACVLDSTTGAKLWQPIPTNYTCATTRNCSGEKWPQSAIVWYIVVWHGGRSCAKSLDSDEIFSPNIHYFVAILRFVAIYLIFAYHGNFTNSKNYKS